MTDHYWTEDRVARLRKLWAAGCSATVIAGQFGCTKNMVIGKVTRLRLPARRTTTTTNGYQYDKRNRWSDEDVALLTALWLDGATGHHIANVLGRKHANVMAKINREGLWRKPRGRAA